MYRGKMIVKVTWLSVATCALALGTTAFAQPAVPASLVISNPASLPQPLFDFHESEIKFNLRTLMSTLRDKRHEGWVLAAYPDPKTKRPLIGAGFSLDVEAVDHPQRDPLNAHTFVEPSSAQLWEAAGLPPEKLDRILLKFDREAKLWATSRHRRKIRAGTLPPQVTEEEATHLLRISAIQAIHNARAYCRGFDQLSASQQMALSQLVFQMGVNLESFTQFLAALNGDPPPPPADPIPGEPVVPRFIPAAASTGPEQWKNVQNTLIDSQWARLYSSRASTVIAMFDPQYSEDPSTAQRQIETTLVPVAVHRSKARASGKLRTAAYTRRAGKPSHKPTPKPHRKRS